MTRFMKQLSPSLIAQLTNVDFYCVV
jgi:CRP-like cAMP-binding protein